MGQKLRYILIAVMIIGGIYWWAPFKRGAELREIEDREEEISSAEDTESSEIEVGPAQAHAQSVVTTEEARLNNQPSSVIESGDLSQLVDQLSVCLEMKGLTAKNKLPSTVQNLEALVKNVAGEIAVQTEEWNATLIELPNGERRNIKIETDYAMDETSYQRLRLYKIESDGSQSLVPLSEDQADRPNEAFIASLEGDGKVLSKQKKSNAYFSNGEEVAVIEQDGVLISFEFGRSEKLLKCQGLNTDKPTCQCSR